jgi:hypothetical protein
MILAILGGLYFIILGALVYRGPLSPNFSSNRYENQCQ